MALFLVGLMTFFMMLFDGVLGFAVPILMTNAGIGTATLGAIFGVSSLIGALFDYFLSSFVRSVSFRRMYLGMFIVGSVYCLTLYQSSGIWMFIVAMGLWGMYFDLLNFAQYDFVSRALPQDHHTTGFSVIDFAKSLGYVVAPIVAGILIEEHVPGIVFVLAGVFLSIGFLVYLVLNSHVPQSTLSAETHHRKIPAIKELVLWVKTARKLHIPLTFILILYVTDSFFWVIGPLFSEDLGALHPFGGLILSAYSLPPLLFEFIVPRITTRFGKKRTAFVAFLCSSVFLMLFAVVTDVVLILVLILLLSTCLTFAYPAIRAAVADYISENPHLSHEIESVADFACNIGYAVGPLLAGIMAQFFGNQISFAMWGILGACIILLLLPHSREDIRIGKIDSV
ncbi:MFS transporter [Candidatus Woesebacteria bacterium]|nr:MFS transporter [Candidatus Woesebacteria bacterium]